MVEMNGYSNKQLLRMLGEHSLWGKYACQEALRRKEDFVPFLLEAIDYAITNPKELADETYELYVPAAFLLAHQREKQAYTRLLELFKMEDVYSDTDGGASIVTFIKILLRDTFNGDTSLLPQIAEDPSNALWVRIKALDTHALLYVDGYVSRKELTEYLRYLFNEVFAGPPENNDMLRLVTMIAGVVQDHHLLELNPEVKNLYDHKWIEREAFGDYDAWLAVASSSGQLIREGHINDAIHDLAECGWFTEESDAKNFEDNYFDSTLDHRKAVILPFRIKND
ncbi:MAG: DUF1186 family protein [Treponema sp.]|jgi:hypothetical protein|nr:DUF1186 family protein [Treponema sp.]